MTEKASPGDRETWWQQQLDNAQESYWNMSRTLKLTQEERDSAESRLAAATALLGRVVRRGPTRGDGLLNGDIQAFLANQHDDSDNTGGR